MSQLSTNENLTAYLDGELSASERDVVQAELDRDPALRAELQALTDVRSFLGEHGAISAPNDFMADLLETIEKEPSNVVPLAWYRRPFGVPVSALAVAAAAVFVFYLSLPTQRAPVSEPELTSPAAAIQAPQQKSYRRKDPPPREAVADIGTPAPELSTVDPDALKRSTPSSSWKNTAEQDHKKRKEKVAKEVDANLDLSPPTSNETLLEKQAVAQRAAERKQQTHEPGQTFTQVPFRYTLDTKDAQALIQLAGIAARYQGELLDTSKNPLQIETLQGSQAATVLVQIPSHALQDFSRAIGSLGSLHSEVDNTMFAGDPVEVRIQVRLTEGVSKAADDPKNTVQQTTASEGAL